MSVLVVLAVLAAAFAVMVSLESQQGAVSMDGLQMNLVLRAGAEHAKALLSVPGDSALASARALAASRTNHWFLIVNALGESVGRYRFDIEDEAAKANANLAARVSDSPGSGWDASEINLARALAVSPARALGLVHYRYGPNRVPGMRGDDDDNNTVLMADGLDNNANGVIDEDDEGVDDPREYHPRRLYGDDRAFSSLHEIFHVLGDDRGSSAIRREISRRATIVAEDMPGSPTLPVAPADINCMNPRQWRTAITKAHWRKPFEPIPRNQARLAVNLVDYRDENHVLSTLASEYGVEAVCFNEVLANDASYIVHTDMLSAEPSHQWLRPGEMRKRYGSADDNRMFYRVNTIYDCVNDDLPSRGWYSPCNSFCSIYYLDPRLAWRVNSSGTGGSGLRVSGSRVTITMPRAPGADANGRLTAMSVSPRPVDLPGGKEWCKWKTPPSGTGGGTFVFGSDSDWTRFYNEVLDVLGKIGKRNGARPQFAPNFFANTEVMIYTWPVTAGGQVRRETSKAVGCFRIISGDEQQISFDARDVNGGGSFDDLMKNAGMTNAAGVFDPAGGPYDLSITMRSWGNRSFIGLSPNANQMVLLRARQPIANRYYKIIIGRPAFGTYNDSYPSRLGVSGRVGGPFADDADYTRRWLYNGGEPVRTKTDGWMDLLITSSDEVSRNKVDQLITYFRVVAPEVVEMYNASVTPVALANWRVICNTGSLATEIGRIDHVTYFDATIGRMVNDVNPHVQPNSHFYLVNDVQLFDYWHGDRSGLWGNRASEQIPAFQMDQDNWGISFRIKRTENRAYVGMVFSLEGAESIDRDRMDLEVIKFVDEEGAGTKESWDGVFAPVVAERMSMVGKGEIVTDNIGSFGVVDRNELAGKKMMILGLPHSGGMVSLTLKNQYRQVCARTVNYGRLDPLDLDVSMEKTDPTKTEWLRCDPPSIGGTDRLAMNRAMRTRREMQFFIKNGPFGSVGELRRVSTGAPFQRLGMSAGGAQPVYALASLADVTACSHVRLEACAGSVIFNGWPAAADEVRSSTSRSIIGRRGGWQANQWSGHRLRFLSGALRGEVFRVFGNADSSLNLAPGATASVPLSSPGRRALQPQPGDRFALGPGYLSPLCYARRNSQKGEWLWKRALTDPGHFHLYVHGLNDRINTTEFVEENRNAALDADVWNWRTQTFDAFARRARYGKDDAFYAGVITPDHVSPDGDFRLQLTANDVTVIDAEGTQGDASANGYAWFNYVTIASVAFPGRVNANTAHPRLLASVPGITPKLAEDIAAGLDASGAPRLKPYLTLGDLLNVRGMTPAIFERCANLLTTASCTYTAEIEAQLFPRATRAGEAGGPVPPAVSTRARRVVLRRLWDAASGCVMRELEQYPVE